jgi:hypothetical protein
VGFFVGFKAMNAFGDERLVAAQSDHQLQKIGGGFKTALGPAFAAHNLHRQLIARIHASTIVKTGKNSSFIRANRGQDGADPRTFWQATFDAGIEGVAFEQASICMAALEASVSGVAPARAGFWAGEFDATIKGIGCWSGSGSSK